MKLPYTKSFLQAANIYALEIYKRKYFPEIQSNNF